MDLGKRLTSQGITWEQLLFQFVIVLVGVYLAIYLERSAKEAGDQARLHDMLGFLLDEIAQDERDIQSILETYDAKLTALDRAHAALVRRSQRDADVIDSLYDNDGFGNRTVYVRRAAYTILSTSGLMAELREADLGFELSNLYEHLYPRLKYNGELLDQQTNEYRDVLQSHWDPVHHRFLQVSARQGASLAIAMDEYTNQHEYYRYLLRRAIESIDVVGPKIVRYLGE